MNLPSRLSSRLARCLLAALPALAVAPPPPAPPAPAQTRPFAAPVDAYLRQVLKDWDIPGMAAAVVKGDVIHAQGYGVRELGRPEPVDVHTIFDSASLTKAFTSTLAAILVDEKRIAWDDPARRHLPQLTLADPYLTEHVTLRDLLSHRTGISSNAMWKLTGISRDEVLRRLRCLAPREPFRTSEVYSNVGYAVAGEALAAAGGASWEELVRRRILEPLGLADTTPVYAEALARPNHASPHAWIDGAQRPLRAERDAIRAATAPAGSVLASVADLARWAQFQMAGGELDGRRIVSAEALRETHEPQVIFPTTPEMRAARHVEFFAAYGLGWNVMDYRGRPLLWHSGSGDGQLAYLAMLPKEKLAAIVLVNTWGAPYVQGPIASYLLDVELGVPTEDWSGKRAARRLAMLAEQSGPSRALLAAASSGPPPTPARYAGTYDSCPWGPLHVRFDGRDLTLQMGEGEIADLRHLRDDTFVAAWRDPLYREERSTEVTFEITPAQGTLRLTAFRDEIEAVRR